MARPADLPADATPGLLTPRRGVALAVLALAALAALIYAQTAGCGFLHFDDPDYVTANPAVRSGLTREGVRAAFSLDASATYWHPLTWLSLMLDAELFGVSAGAMHLVNAGLHALAAIFFFLFLHAATGRLAESLLAAAVFAAHPLAVEAVAWVAERKTVLSGALAMAAVLAHARYARKPGPGRYLLLAGLTALGLMAKPTLAALPLGLLALDFWPLRRLATAGLRRLALEKLPLLALALAAAGLAMASRQDVSLDPGPGPHAALALRLANIPVACIRYLEKFLWPRDLSVFYPFPASIPAWQWAGATALLLALLGTAWLARRRAPHLLLGLAWFLVMLAPVSGLVQTGLWPALADRFAYLPMAGLAVALSWGLYALLGAHRGLASMLAAALVLAHFGLAAWAQARLWGSGVELFGQAVRLAPRDPVSRHHLGMALLHEGRMEEALEEFQEARNLAPSYVRPGIMSGEAMLRLMEFPGAGRAFRDALALDIGSRDARLGLAEALAGQGEPRAAADQFTMALANNPGDFHARMGVARVLLDQGDALRALQALEEGRGRGPVPARALSLAGRAQLVLGRAGAARQSFAAALEREPELAEALEGVAEALEALDRRAEGVEYRRRAGQVRTSEAAAFVHLGRAALEAKRFRDAAGHFRRALSLRPGLAEAVQGLDSATLRARFEPGPGQPN